MASGKPSSLRQISHSAGASASVSMNAPSEARARSLNNCTAECLSASAAVMPARSVGISRGARRYSASPSARSGSRLVARMPTRGAALNIASATDRRRIDDMLAIVEHDQRLLVAQPGDQPGQRVAGRAPRPARRRWHWIPDQEPAAMQRDKPDAVRI